MLFRLVVGSSSIFQHTIVSLTGEGYYGPKLRDSGAKVYALEMRRRLVSWWQLRRLYNIVCETKPQIVQTWMHHANLVGAGIARLAGVRPVVWGIHNPDLSPVHNSLFTRLVGHTAGLLSTVLPSAIIYVSEQSLEAHRKRGFRSALYITIPNGVDMARFCPNQTERIRVRSEWGIVAGEFLLGFVARWDSYKDHRNLLSALSLLAQRGTPFRCVLVGGGMDRNNFPLLRQIAAHGLEDHIITAGSRSDIPGVMNALDLHVLCSAAEAFPLVTVEAMASGTPCVTTNVGGAISVIGNTGWVVEPRAPEALAGAIECAMVAIREKGKDTLGKACRERVKHLFGLETMVANYTKLWKELAQR